MEVQPAAVAAGRVQLRIQGLIEARGPLAESVPEALTETELCAAAMAAREITTRWLLKII